MGLEDGEERDDLGFDMTLSRRAFLTTGLAAVISGISSQVAEAAPKDRYFEREEFYCRATRTRRNENKEPQLRRAFGQARQRLLGKVPDGGRCAIISIHHQQIYECRRHGNQIVIYHSSRISTGARATPTPAGLFQISRELKPGFGRNFNTYGGKRNDLYGDKADTFQARGTRKRNMLTRGLYLNIKGANGKYWIHGTPWEQGISKALSGGCARVCNDDVEKLNLGIGNWVVITHER